MPDPSAPLVTVIIVTRDRPALLRRAVLSVLAQAHRPVELLVIDNQSQTPPSLTDLSLGDGVQLRQLQTPSFLTAANSRNLGIDQATGSLLCFLDDDDTYLAGKLSGLVALMQADPTMAMAYGNTAMVGPQGSDLGVCRGPAELPLLMHYRHVHLNALMVRADIARAVRFDPQMTTFEDLDFAVRLLQTHRCAHLDRTLAVWNRDNRPDQLTGKNWPRAYLNWKILCDRHRSVIDASAPLRRLYYRKMALLALQQRRPVEAARYAWRLVGATGAK